MIMFICVHRLLNMLCAFSMSDIVWAIDATHIDTPENPFVWRGGKLKSIDQLEIYGKLELKTVEVLKQSFQSHS